MTLVDWFNRLRAAVVDRTLDRAHQDEVEFHLDMAASRLERSGVDAHEARRRARAAFGGVQRYREESREARGAHWWTDLVRDAGYAVRQLRRAPGFASVAVVTLALGIGANTALFSVVDGVLLRPVPLLDSDRLVVVWETDRNSGTMREPASWPDYLDFAAQSRTVRAMAVVAGREGTYTPRNGEPQRVPVMSASHNYFPLVGIAAARGRTFTPEEDVPGGPAVALISDAFWRQRLNADPNVLGTAILVDEVARQIVGVVPSGSDFGLDQLHARAAYRGAYTGIGDVGVWIPVQASEASFPRYTHPFFVVGRLADDAGVGAAEEELRQIAAGLEAAHQSNVARGTFVEPFREVVFAPVRPVLLLLLTAVALVLLVACVNVANLLLARGATRQREVAVRTSLGAGYARLARQFMVESLLLAFLGGVAGVAMAWVGLRVLLAIAPADVPRVAEIGIDGTVLAVTLGVSVLVGLAFGLVPTLQARHVDISDTLKGEGRGGSYGVRQRRVREGLVVTELALSVSLLLCAGLVLRSLGSVLRVDPGFNADGVLKAEYILPATRYPRDFRQFPNWPDVHRFTNDVLQRVGALPGVQSVAIASAHPLDAGFTNSFVVVGREAEARDWPEISVRMVSAGYFGTMGGTVRQGRPFTDADDTSAPLVGVINETAAKRFFADRDPLGQQIAFWGIPRRIVGVVSDERFRGPTEPAPPAFYVPLAQAPAAGGALLVRTTRDPAELATEVRNAVWSIDPQLAVFGIEPLGDTLLASQATRRFTSVVLTAFAALTLALALVGIHGVLSYATSQRRREIGIRMALGATRREAATLVVRGGVALAVMGTAIGLAGAAAGSRFVSGLLFGVTRSDPVTYASVAVLAIVAAVIATTLPALRAARVVPTEALRRD